MSRARRARRTMRRVAGLWVLLVLVGAACWWVVRGIPHSSADAGGSAVPSPGPAAPSVTASTPASGGVAERSQPAAPSLSLSPEAPLSEAGPGDVRDLQPALRHAILAAIYAAKADGVTLDVNSGYRTPQHQEELFEEGIKKYGSAQAAHAWVLPPDQSDHVTGNAVDVEPAAGIAWLERNGVRFGLCRKYANENWHFELLAPNVGQTCPPMLPHA